MRAFIALTLTLALTSCLVSADMDKYENMLKKWGKMKAMEGCFGDENMKMWMLKMKKAKAMCSGKPAIELELPMFQGKVRMANALVNAGQSQKQNDFIDNLMRNAFIKKMMRRQMIDLMGEDDDDMPFVAKLRSRFTRDTDTDAKDAGDNSLNHADDMVAKLKMMEMDMVTEISNMTCVLQECGILNADMEIDAKEMDKFADEMKWTAEETGDGVDRTWLHTKVKEIHHMCKDLSDAVPDSILNSCSLPHYVTRIIYFKKCKKFHKFEACMLSDVMNKVSGHGMSMEELAEKAGQDVEKTAAVMAIMVLGNV